MPPSARSRRSIPAPWRAGRSRRAGWPARLGGVRVLAFGTALIAVGYGLAGLTGSLYGVIAGLLLAGLGGSTQHPIASSLVVGGLSRPALAHSARHLQFHRRCRQGGCCRRVFALIAASLGWQQALIVIAAHGRAWAPASILASLQPVPMHAKGGEATRPIAGQDRPWAYWLLFSHPHRRRSGAHRLPDLPAVPAARQGRRPADHRPRPVAAVRRRRRGQAGDGLGRRAARRRAVGRS